MASGSNSIGAFIEGAPPGELSHVLEDIKALAPDVGDFKAHRKAFEAYNEEQLTTVKLPGGGNEVIISAYNKHKDGRYFDSESKSTFEVDHVTANASNLETHNQESQHADLIASLHKAFRAHAAEHYPSSTIAVFATSDDSEICLLLVANKYSPNNFWNGRWRSTYLLDPKKQSISGKIEVDVHYYEDGNVRLLTNKPLSSATPTATATEVVRQIAMLEKRYQEDLNRAFTQLNESAFKNLRRQLPVTRQKVEWDKIAGYRVGQQIGGGRSR